MAELSVLEDYLSSLPAVVVAFSGGADSALVAHVANRVLGRGRCVVATAVSASLAEEELADCESLAEEWGLDWRTAVTGELSNRDYAANGPKRCYYCKAELMAALSPLADELGGSVALGVNLDDLNDQRPGQVAAAESGAVFPLVEAGFDKAEVRRHSRELGLRTWDKPQAACLASRVPYGTPVSLEVLGRVGRAESGLRRLGFRQLRVRHHGDIARIELEAGELQAAIDKRAEVVAAVRAAGYRWASLDLEGFRSGGMNSLLQGPQGSSVLQGPQESSTVAGHR